MHGGAAPQVKFAALERLKALQPKAITVLESLLDREEFPTVQMAAVRDVMDRTEGKARENLDVHVTDEMALLDRLDRIKARNRTTPPKS